MTVNKTFIKKEIVIVPVSQCSISIKTATTKIRVSDISPI